MKTKIVKIEGQLAIIIPDEILKKLNIDQNTILEIEVVEDKILITPIRTGKKNNCK